MGRYYPIFTVANIDSREPAKVVEGNERVVRPRLSDAAFSFELENAPLLPIAYQPPADNLSSKDLGSLFERVQRISRCFQEKWLTKVGCRSFAGLSRLDCYQTDLVTSMVLGSLGFKESWEQYYAKDSGEAVEVAGQSNSITILNFPEMQYLQVSVGFLWFSGGKAMRLPEYSVLTNHRPVPKDPFTLRRAGLGASHHYLKRNLKI